ARAGQRRGRLHGLVDLPGHRGGGHPGRGGAAHPNRAHRPADRGSGRGDLDRGAEDSEQHRPHTPPAQDEPDSRRYPGAGFGDRRGGGGHRAARRGEGVL
ncbi:MAG: hypothetical protein AVDCRST_MAG12-1056, partial [uncultured Rubrobacteraceae bacterium]